jgi:BirA family transcriptional regulator, biotin operon repressor / biotin---[acetyl-CoA-carboxylase] ligase
MIGRPRVHHRVTDSTNERARELATAGAPHGTLVTADEQRAGRGRQGRAWSAPAGSAVLMSVVLRDVSETLPLAAAVAVCEALPVEARIKWPNDVWISERKVAGILVEARPQEGWAVLGIGVNVAMTEFPAELADSATSLALAGAPASVESTLASLVASLDVWLPRPPDEVLAAWRPRDALLGQTIRWENGSKEGIAAGIDSSGALIVETASGSITLDAGEVHLDR